MRGRASREEEVVAAVAPSSTEGPTRVGEAV